MRFGSDARPQLAASDPVLAWRRAQLLEAGFDRDRAQCLAADRRRDLHALLELVDRGCPPVLAARILAPIDELPIR